MYGGGSPVLAGSSCFRGSLYRDTPSGDRDSPQAGPRGAQKRPSAFRGDWSIATRRCGLILVLRPLKTLRWHGSPFLDAGCAPHRARCGDCGGAPVQAPHRLHGGECAWHLMRAAPQTARIKQLICPKRQIVIVGR